MAAKELSRHTQRMLAFQVLYGQDFLACPTEESLREAFLSVPRQNDVLESPDPCDFAWALVLGVWNHREELDSLISRYSQNWRLDRVGRVELNLLRLSIFEMLYREDVPIKVSMNEALDLDRQYGDGRSRPFVNGLLDAVAHAVEKGEICPKA